MKNAARKTTLMGILLNSFLFLIKFATGMITHSLIVISEAFHSLTDIVSSIGIYIAVRVSGKKADKGHPFGHHRAEPIAGLVVAIFTGIVAFEIIKNAITEWGNPAELTFGVLAIGVMAVTLLIKSLMAFYFVRIGRTVNSPAIVASGHDGKHDAIIAIVGLCGVIAPMHGYPHVDNVIAIFLGFYVLYSGYKIGIENINYLMGHAPPQEEINTIRNRALSVKSVKGVHDVKAHYVGNYIHVEVHIEVDRKLSTLESHDIGKGVQRTLEELSNVDKAFIHIDPH